MVFQKPTPFPMSIYDNVAAGLRVDNRVGKVKGSDLDDVVEKALTQAALWDEVKDRLRASALALSGGQQQRLCIARTIAPQPQVVLLDEPTASLDSESEQLVQDAIARLCRGRTTLVVAHRLQTIVHADRILVIEGGVVVESGRHDDLLRRNGRYASFHRLQLREESTRGPVAVASSA
jgi:ABC-type phosphate transport system ATPase subunit